MNRRLTDQELIQELELRFAENKKSFEEQHQLMIQLQQLNRKLEQSEALKSNFLSNIRNEMNNPFTAILGLSRSIIKAEGSDYSKIRSMASLIHLEAFNLDFQLRNIFAAAEIEAGEAYPQIVSTDIHKTICGVIDSFNEIAGRKLITIEHSFSYPEMKFNTDPLKFQLIISNLLSNAIEFSFPDTMVSIQVELEDDHLFVKVKDAGMGIRQEDIPKVFDRFTQLDDGMTKNHKGHGLGLSVSQSLAENLQGKISVESNGAGSTFILVLPASTDVSNPYYSEEGNDTLFTSDEKF